MKEQLQDLIHASLQTLVSTNYISDREADIILEEPKQQEHGDLASNIALVLAKRNGLAPRELANKIIACLPKNELITKTEIAGPGFINFFVKQQILTQVVADILNQGDNYACNEQMQHRKILIEFVSANPTGPLHVGHGRSAVLGDCIANLLLSQGAQVIREYYVNDAGRQMDILAVSVWLRYLELHQHVVVFPNNGYQGEYIREIAQSLQNEHGEQFLINKALPIFDAEPELAMDQLIDFAKNYLKQGYEQVHKAGLDSILDDIKNDLSGLGVHFNCWYSEKSLWSSGALETALKALEQAGATYERAGAVWFKSTAYGDEKDRVIRRSNGQFTYFASDIAYHLSKFERGSDELIDILGADHHGYMARLKAFLLALGKPAEKLEFCLVQFVSLFRNKEKIAMSTRSGSFVTLRELRDEVGNDVVRYFYIMRRCGQHVDFDLDLAKQESNENPVFTIQYAHARICSLFEKLEASNQIYDERVGIASLSLLIQPQEIALAQQLLKYKEIVMCAAQHLEPHRIAQYLLELAGDYHAYYNAHRVLDIDSPSLVNARLALNKAVKQVLKNGLGLLGIHAPNKM